MNELDEFVEEANKCLGENYETLDDVVDDNPGLLMAMYNWLEADLE